MADANIEQAAADAAAAKAKADADAAANANQKSYSEEEFKKVVAERQEAKAKLKEFEVRIAAIDEEKKKASEKDLTKDQLIAQREQELAALKAEKDTLTADVAKYREKQEALKKSLLEKITDADLKKLGEKLDVDELTIFVEKVTGNKFAGTQKGSLDKQAPTFKTFSEWEKYMKENNLVT